MEINKIEIRNLNSLKGEFHLDFTSGKLKDQEIFAIIGPTGSGKSTILDAITLALYNRVPRLDGKKGKGDERSPDPYKRLSPDDTRNTLSRGTKSGYAKIVFEVSGQQYRAEWFCERRNVNIVGSHTLFLLKSEKGTEKAELMVTNKLVHEFDRYGNPMDKYVSKEVVNLIGLGYDQFCKACILAQNSFANFLKANDFEKADILEKITGTTIYRRIAGVIVDGYNNSIKKKTAIDDQIGGLMKFILEEDKLEQLKDEKRELSNEKKMLKNKLKYMEKGVSWWGDLEKLEIIKAEAQKKKDEAEEELRRILPSRERVERHDKLEKGIGLLGKELDAQKDFNAAHESVTDVQSKLTENQKLIKAKEREKTKAEKRLKTSQKILNKLGWVKNIKEHYSLIESEYTNLSYSVDALQKAAEKYSPESGYEKKSERVLVNAIRKLTENVSQDLTLETQKDCLLKIKNNLELCALADKLFKKMERVSGLDSDDTKDQTTIDLNQPEKDRLTTDIKNLERHIGALENEDFGIKRGQLKEGEPCELCGATHHPFSTAVILNEVIERLKTQRDNENNEMEKIDGIINTAVHNMSTRSGERLALNEDISELKRTLIAADESLSTIFSNYSVEAQIQELKSKAVQKSGLEHELAEAENLSILLELRDLLGGVDSHIARLSKYLPEGWYSRRANNKVRYAEALKKNKELYEEYEKRVLTEKQAVNGLKTTIDTLKGLIPALNQEIIKKGRICEKKKKSLAKATSALNSWIRIFNAKNGDPVSREDLVAQKEDKTNWGDLRSKINTADKDHIKQDTQFDLADKALQKHLKKNDKPVEDKKSLESQKNECLSHLEKGPNSIEERLGNIKGELVKHNSATREIKAFSKLLEKAALEVNLWKRFYNMLGDGKGDKEAKEFRKLAQNYTLGLLLKYANKELERFTKRYKLKKQNDSSLEIMVLDGELGERYSSSLSGGETFMVSLALALGLSSISSGSVTLKDIFIDEGFGTLDSDTQKTVVGALYKLRTQGKRIGLISHVSALLQDDNIYKIQIQRDMDNEKFSGIKQ